MKYISFASLFTLAIVAFGTGCKKQADTIAKITIRNADNNVVAGAVVSLYGESTEGKQNKVVVGDTTTSNANGEAIFNLNDVYKNGQAGVAVLNIAARKDQASGSGIIQVKEKVTSEQTVVIQE